MEGDIVLDSQLIASLEEMEALEFRQVFQPLLPLGVAKDWKRKEVVSTIRLVKLLAQPQDVRLSSLI